MDVYGDFVHFSPRRFCQIDLIPLWCCSAFLGFLSSTKARKKLQRRHVANEHRAEAEVARRENEVRFKRRFQVPSADFLDLQNSIPLRRILHLPKLHFGFPCCDSFWRYEICFFLFSHLSWKTFRQTPFKSWVVPHCSGAPSVLGPLATWGVWAPGWLRDTIFLAIDGPPCSTAKNYHHEFSRSHQNSNIRIYKKVITPSDLHWLIGYL